ncbi:MAG: TRAP transporter fused permease subunit [Betaproteobacteria bacterium]|nr:TRAP transporter fused permease subunit [Betaproteobacteria bacterium]
MRSLLGLRPNLTLDRVTAGLAVCLALFHIMTAQFGLLPGLQQRIVHLTVILALIFLSSASRSAKGGRARFGSHLWLNLCLALLAIVAGGFTYLVEETISDSSRIGTMTTGSLVIGVLLIVLCLEAARQVLGLAFPLIVLVGVAYIIWGGALPPPLDHPPVSFSRAIEFLYFSPEGIFGLALGVSATYLVLFVIFGAFMSHSGLNDFTFDLSRSLLHRSTGGLAKIAVTSSGVVASVTGSDMANAASTGAVTIPLMIRAGYPRAFAAAVEAVASNGAQLMPPVMGTAAFLMAEIVRVPYGEVVLAAALPGFLYYVLVYAIIHLRSARLGLRGGEESSLSAWRILCSRGHLVLPILILLYMVVVAEVSIMRAAYYSVLSVILVTFLRRNTWMKPPAILRALRDGGFSAMGIGVACALVGIVMGVFGVTGLGLKLSGALIELAGGNVVVLLLLTALTSLILGTGLPTLPTYIILAILVAPALIQLGIDPLAAHLFIFYFGNVSSVTPPVALNVIITASIARSNFWETGWLAIRMSLATFLLPFAFVIDPALILRGDPDPASVIVAVILALAGLLALAVALEGYWRSKVPVLLRLLGGVGAIILVVGKYPIALMGAALFVPIVWHQWRTRGIAKEL